MTPDDSADPQMLRRIHVLLTRMLAELDRVCRRLEVSYAAYGGTAIGAVRHKGFIPWDDDVDVLMPRWGRSVAIRSRPADGG